MTKRGLTIALFASTIFGLILAYIEAFVYQRMLALVFWCMVMAVLCVICLSEKGE